jgi:hypothetical protein
MDDIKKITEDLTKLRMEIDDANSEMNQLEGAEKQQLENIKKTFDVKDNKAGEKLLKKWDKELVVLKKEISDDYKKLKDNFEW